MALTALGVNVSGLVCFSHISLGVLAQLLCRKACCRRRSFSASESGRKLRARKRDVRSDQGSAVAADTTGAAGAAGAAAGAAGMAGAAVVRRAERRGLAAAVAAGRAPVCSEGRDAESVVNRMAISSAK
eukprot:scaffold49395_cov65-Phaeocystis_antarctica.AAC.1